MSISWFSEQARKELEEEQRLKEQGDKGLSGSPRKPDEPAVPEYTMDAEKGHEVDPANYAVHGVFYTCSLIGKSL